VKAQVIGPFIS